nr:MAG TPA: hypothetical protein [Caudoviricetes sp.]
MLYYPNLSNVSTFVRLYLYSRIPSLSPRWQLF